MPYKKIVFFVAAVLCWVASLTGCDDNSTSYSPPVFVSASQLCADYGANQVAADAKYKGKILRISGTIEAIETDILDNSYVLLRGANSVSAQCYFTDKSKLVNLRKDTSISLNGVCEGYIAISVCLKNCAL